MKVQDTTRTVRSLARARETASSLVPLSDRPSFEEEPGIASEEAGMNGSEIVASLREPPFLPPPRRINTYAIALRERIDWWFPFFSSPSLSSLLQEASSSAVSLARCPRLDERLSKCERGECMHFRPTDRLVNHFTPLTCLVDAQRKGPRDVSAVIFIVMVRYPLALRLLSMHEGALARSRFPYFRNSLSLSLLLPPCRIRQIRKSR